MIRWQDIEIRGIARIEKLVAEFDVIELEKTPCSKFKVKIYESPDGAFMSCVVGTVPLAWME